MWVLKIVSGSPFTIRSSCFTFYFHMSSSSRMEHDAEGMQSLPKQPLEGILREAGRDWDRERGRSGTGTRDGDEDRDRGRDMDMDRTETGTATRDGVGDRDHIPVFRHAHCSAD